MRGCVDPMEWNGVRDGTKGRRDQFVGMGVRTRRGGVGMGVIQTLSSDQSYNNSINVVLK